MQGISRNGRAAVSLSWALLAWLVLAPAPASAAAEGPGEIVPGRAIVGYERGASEREARAAAAGVSAAPRGRPLLGRRVRLLRLREGVGVRAALRRLRARPGVAYAEPDRLGRYTGLSNDPRLDVQWGLHNTGLGYGGALGVPGADISAAEAWDLSLGTGAVIAIVDSGVDYKHPDLAARIWRNPGELGAGRGSNGIDDDGNGVVDDHRGYDFAGVDEDRPAPDNNPIDELGHGSHVAGIAAASGGNGIGGSGVAPDAELMAVKAGTARAPVLSAVVKAIRYADRMGADVVNLSIEIRHSRALRDAIRRAPGLLIVTAAGNFGLNLNLRDELFDPKPCTYPHSRIVCVAATDDHDRLARFSNRGSRHVDLAAPGVGILSTVPRDTAVPAFSEDFRRRLRSRFDLSGGPWRRIRDRFGSTALTDSRGRDYANGIDARATLAGTIDLRDSRRCRLFAIVRGQTERGRDFFSIEARRGQGAWRPLVRDSGKIGPAYSKPVRRFRGADRMGLRFRLTSDGSDTGPGIRLSAASIDCSGDYAAMDGTSMASPHVAGAAALLASAFPTETPFDIKRRLLDTVDATPSLVERTASGGRLNAARALGG